MRRSRKPILIASRRSRLARIQAEMVGNALGKLHPKLSVEYRWIESEGDRHSAAMLAQVGGKGLFSRAIEQAVLSGKADLAVHSLKDLPAEDSTGLVLAAAPRRGDVRDCLVSRAGAGSLEELKPGAVLGTASPRRAAQALRLRPDLRIELMRGNVQTRVSKVMHAGLEGIYDATLMARAGLARAGLGAHTQAVLSVEQMLPAACQGALAIQCRADDHVALTRCLPLNDATTSTAVHVERQVIAGLGADCHSPVAVLAEPMTVAGQASGNADAHWFRLRVRVLSADGRRCLEVDEKARTKDLRHLVKRVVADLLGRGARSIMEEAGRAAQVEAPMRLRAAVTQVPVVE